jgi:hypothetical protein
MVAGRAAGRLEIEEEAMCRWLFQRLIKVGPPIVMRSASLIRQIFVHDERAAHDLVLNFADLLNLDCWVACSVRLNDKKSGCVRASIVGRRQAPQLSRLSASGAVRS